MALPIDPAGITHSIQLAVAPVFLLTAVAGMMGVVAGRLARIIDRGRKVEERALACQEAQELQLALQELAWLRRRGRLANVCIGLLTLCALLIGLTIVVLFVGETLDWATSRWAANGFLTGVLAFMLALLSFFVETLMAMRALDFHMPHARRRS